MDDKQSTAKDAQNARSACTECQRRKQKCNREWPCNHCQKRKVADQCRFKDLDVKSPPEQPRKRERHLESEAVDDYDEVNGDEGDIVDDFEKLGYAPGHLIAGMKEGDEKTGRKSPKQYLQDMNSCPQLQRAVTALPPRPYTDSLVHNFFSNVNFHYYIIYPNSFLNEYQSWWEDRAANRALSLQWTCLLLHICACSAQYIPEDLQRKLAGDLGRSSQTLTEDYHAAAKDLQGAIPAGHSHLLNVQSLLHSCYWYKSEAQFVECWHVLNSAIREAQELGIDKESVQRNVTDFERELHRRVWVVLDTWDWQISALLSRPMIIDRSDCDVGLPSLSLESFKISPLMHMKMQSELITKLSKRFGLPKNVTSPPEVQEYQRMMEEWMGSFPPTYDFKNPDTSDDAANTWIVLHRHYLHTMGYSMTLDPIRAYLAKPMNSKTTSPIELQIRQDGIDYALKIMDALYGFFDHVWPRDAKFHFVIFCIFDTAAVYSSVIMHDEDNSAPKRQEMLKAMEGALWMVKRLSVPVPAAGMYHNILTRLYKKTLKKINGVAKKPDAPRKKARVASVAKSQEAKETAQLSHKSASSVENLPVEGQSSSSTSSSDPPAVQFEAPAQPPPLVYPQPPAIPAETIPLQPMYDFNQTPFLSETYPVQDPTLFNSAACVLDGGGGLPPLPGAEFRPNGEFVPDLDPAGMPDMAWAPMSEAELGELGALWRWKSLDLGLVTGGEGSVDPGQLGLDGAGGMSAGGLDGNGYILNGNENGGVTGVDEDVDSGRGGVNGHINGYAGNGNGFP